MVRNAWALALVLPLLACPAPGPNNPDGGNPGGSDGGTNLGDSFVRLTLDGSPTPLSPLAMAVGPQDQVGVAYFVRTREATDTQTEEFELRFVEWQGGQASAPERVVTVNLVYGVALAYDSNGRAAVSYLGGGADQSLEWLQSDLAVSYRQAPGQWVEQIAVRRSNEVLANNPVSDFGVVVGINPAMTFDGTRAYVAYRDVHGGQYPQQDWAGSDLELAEGGPTSWAIRMVKAGGNDKQAWGGHISMVMAGSQPALVHDQVFGSANGTGQNVFFQRRQADGTWSAQLKVQSVSNTQLGASLAWDSQRGYGIAVLERSNHLLTYTESANGSTWTQPDPVFQQGAGGWYPSLAFHPSEHQPHIAFYVCSLSASANEFSCDSSVDELRLVYRVGNRWQEQVLDEAGGWSPKLGFLSTGQRAVAYRDPATAAVYLAVER